MIRNYLVFMLLMTVIAFMDACRHNPLFENPVPDGTDSSEVVVPVDTTSMLDSTNLGSGCSPDSIYFNRDILPLFVSRCATAGCHDEVTHEEGLRLVSYDRIVPYVRPGKPQFSTLYEVMTEDRDSKRMPPPPREAFSTDELTLVRKWIEQGALNLECTETSSCTTAGITFSGFIQPLIRTNCLGCHSTINPGAGIQLTSYEQIQSVARSGRLYGSISGATGSVRMPQGGQLDACTIMRVKAWIDAGSPNN